MKIDLNDVAMVFQLAGFKNITNDGTRVRCSCPFSPYTHGHKNGDQNPSFTIYHGDTVDKTLYICPCGESGAFEKLFANLQTHAMVEGDKAARQVFTDCVEATKALLNGSHFSAKAASIASAPEGAIAPSKASKLFVEYPSTWLDQFPPVIKIDHAGDTYIHVAAHEYLIGRGFTDEQIVAADVRVDEYRKMVGFPYFNRDGLLAGMRGRSYRKNPHYKHHCYVHEIDGKNFSNQMTTWYREYELYTDKQGWKNCPIIVVESAIDAALIGCNSTAMFGLNGDLEKWKFFKGSAGVVFLGDGDCHGNDAPEVAIYRKKARGYCEQLGIPFFDAYFPVGFKDAGEMAMDEEVSLNEFIDSLYDDLLKAYEVPPEPKKASDYESHWAVSRWYHDPRAVASLCNVDLTLAAEICSQHIAKKTPMELFAAEFYRLRGLAHAFGASQKEKDKYEVITAKAKEIGYRPCYW